MDKRELAVVVSNDNQNVNAIETIDAIIDAGFKNVFIQWYDKKFDPSQEEQLKYIRQKGLKIIFAHLGYQNINDLWLSNEAGEQLVYRYIEDIKECKENGIDLVIMHLQSKNDSPPYNDLGILRLKKIISYAKSLDIKIAFENTRMKGYLEYVFEKIDSDNIGICFDSGHYHAFFNDDFDFNKFKDKIFAVHLHDNDKSSDQHLIPFDGTLDWNKIATNLQESNYNGPITMELCYRYDYLNMKINDFYRKGFEVGEKLQNLF